MSTSDASRGADYERVDPGWEVVVWSDLSEHWENDWDGVLHATREGAEASAAEALRAGYLPQIVRLVVESERPDACPYECTNCQQLARMGIAPKGRTGEMGDG